MTEESGFRQAGRRGAGGNRGTALAGMVAGDVRAVEDLTGFTRLPRVQRGPEMTSGEPPARSSAWAGLP